MKKLLVTAVSLALLTTAFGTQAANLRMKIAGIKDNRYFLCVSGVGCVSMLHGNKGKTYPLHAGDIGNIYTVNATNMTMHTQALPSSCNKSVSDGQTLVVSGKLLQGSGGRVQIAGLRCAVS